MKVAFVEPSTGNEALSFGWLNKMPMLGPLYLGTILKNRGHDVSIYLERLSGAKHVRDDVDILCITTMTPMIGRAYQIAQDFKKRNPDKKVIIGGTHASVLPEEAAKYADHVVVGESESIIADVIEGKYKEKIIYTDKCQDLDALPFPDFSMVTDLKKTKVFPIMTTRGCPYNCSFCLVSELFGRKIRERSTDNVIKELAANRFKRIFFYDDHFCAKRERTNELLRKMKDNGIANWRAQARAEVGGYDDFLKLAADTNCEYLLIGFESINQATLDSINKRWDLKKTKEYIKKIHDYGIKIYGMFIFGSDSDDKHTIQKTEEFVAENGIEIPQYSLLTPLPGTKLFKQYNDEKRIFTYDWSRYDLMHVVSKPKMMSAYDLQVQYNNAVGKSWVGSKRGYEFLAKNITSIPEVLYKITKRYRYNLKYLDKLKAMPIN
jgi:anaerobic magnesium-protoporphyrin IX monomethyl ester cyclase